MDENDETTSGEGNRRKADHLIGKIQVVKVMERNLTSVLTVTTQDVASRIKKLGKLLAGMTVALVTPNWGY